MKVSYYLKAFDVFKQVPSWLLYERFKLNCLGRLGQFFPAIGRGRVLYQNKYFFLSVSVVRFCFSSFWSYKLKSALFGTFMVLHKLKSAHFLSVN